MDIPRLMKKSRTRRLRFHLGYLLFGSFATILTLSGTLRGDEPTRPSETDTAKIDFFESRIRPVLVEQCYQCHNSNDTDEGGLALDHREGLLNGGDGGPIIVAGHPEQSRLLSILRHEVDGFEMPEDGPKLSDEVIADFETWIANDALDPRDEPPSPEDLAAATSWESTLKRRKQWWSFQPIQQPEIPPVTNAEWDHPIDRFILSKMESAGLAPATPAGAAALVRRLYFNLIGLPPSPTEAKKWTKMIGSAKGAKRDLAIAALVDALLESPRFGERWARHWMDWIRYAESHGSEGDPRIENAWQYRDYLIRALNADVPYDQLVREHVAGDLLEKPRVNEELGINESAIGPAHWRMVFHGFAPTDALDEKVRFTDDQINAFSKAFLGLTVSCARCHDHKFDAISQRDYYALFGILGSCRPGRHAVDLPVKNEKYQTELVALKRQIRRAVASDWLSSIGDLATSLTDRVEYPKDAEKAEHLLHPLYKLAQAQKSSDNNSDAWQEIIEAYRDRIHNAKAFETQDRLGRWELSETDDFQTWFTNRTDLPDKPSNAGEFSVAASGENALTGIYPAGVYSHGLSQKQTGRLTSPDFLVGEENELWVRVIGDGGSSLRYVVQNYPRNGTVYPVHQLKNGWHWQRFDLTYWEGDMVHIELSTAMDAPLLVKNNPRSWFGIREAFVQRKRQPAPDGSWEHFEPILSDIGQSGADEPKVPLLASLYQTTISAAIEKWRDGQASDGQALLLNECLRVGLISNSLESLPTARHLVQEYRKLEEAISVPIRVPGLDETVAHDQALFERGNHRKPSERVPRRFLEAIDDTPYETELSGRRELAEDLLRTDNPLTRRVIVNRIWHHLFGAGIVNTPDNFGRMGDTPSHPKLLDYLANRFENGGGSLKKLIRQIVSSKTWQQSAEPSAQALEIDPQNRLLSHANVRRLEAESIRDALLVLSGRLDGQLFGDPVDGNAPRRSVYVRVIRNNLDPFLRAFDFPEPYSTTGRRDVTNVPAQSLTMINDKQVASVATHWADRILANPNLHSSEERIREMFYEAFGRPATDGDVLHAASYIQTTVNGVKEVRQRKEEFRSRIAENQAAIDAIIEPIRENLKRAAEKSSDNESSLPRPAAAWEFAEAVDDLVGGLEGKLESGAVLQDGALVVRNRGHVNTSPLNFNLREKTLEVWVQLATLDQSGGGVMTVQTPDGIHFDSIVFAERASREWMAGSDGFTRTESFAGEAEHIAADEPIHFAIAYHADGTIAGYRNGVLYGKPYRSNGPYEFKAGNAIVSFGVRHLPADRNKNLNGRILRANLYDRALSAEEIAATSGNSRGFVSRKQIRATMSDEVRLNVDRLEDEISRLELALESLGPIPEGDEQSLAWRELAMALLTFKELVYLK